MEVYMDNSATTRTFPEVAELMTKIMCEDYGNPSSLHMKGVEAEKYLRYAKETLARILKVEERELLFTSGGTESDNMALIGCALANCRRGNHLITTQIEHPAILQTMRYLETQGYRVTYLPVDPCGRIRLEDLRRAMTPETILVSIMHTNNEIGALQPIEEAGALIKQMNPDTLFHVDAVQGFGKSRIYPKKMHIDLGFQWTQDPRTEGRRTAVCRGTGEDPAHRIRWRTAAEPPLRYRECARYCGTCKSSGNAL